jgi:hypothetical protein
MLQRSFSRRDILSGIKSASAVGALGLTGAFALPRPSHAWWVAAIQAAAAVASAIASFTQRGDGGLAAYLASIRELQLETINQLIAVRTQLADLHSKIMQIPEVVEGLLDQKFLQHYQSQLYGAFDEFREVVALRSSSRQLSSDELSAKKLKENRLRERIVETRQTLQNFAAISGGPHAAMIASFIFPIELSARYFIGEPKEVIREAIHQYRSWRSTILDSNNEFSTPRYLAKWLKIEQKRHKDAGDRSQLAWLSLSDGLHEAPLQGADACFSYQEITPGGFPPAWNCERSDPNSYYFSLHCKKLPDKVGSESRIYIQIKKEERLQDGVKIISLRSPYVREYPLIDAKMSHAIRFFQESNYDTDSPPRYMVVPLPCSVTKGPPRPASDRLIVIKADREYLKAQREIESLYDDVEGINEARFRIGLAANAHVIASSLEDRFKDAERYYAT